MERRKFLIGAGSAAVGASALVGSGAFTSVSANRSFTVDVAGDANAYLKFDAGLKSSSNDVHASINEDGKLVVDIDENNDGGSGVNQDSVTTFDQVFKLVNQGPESVNIWFEHDIEPLTFYRFDPDDNSLDGSSNAKLGLKSGGHMKIGIEVDTTGEESLDEISGTVTIRADTEDTE